MLKTDIMQVFSENQHLNFIEEKIQNRLQKYLFSTFLA